MSKQVSTFVEIFGKMVVEIDFEKKEITLKDNVLLGDLIEKLKGLELNDWKQWKIRAFEKTVELVPYYPYVPITYPTYPWTYTTGDGIYKPPYKITCDDMSSSITVVTN